MKKYLDHKFSNNESQLKDTSYVHYFELPYIGNFSHHTKNKLSKPCKEFCKQDFNTKLVFNSFKIKIYLSYKDPVPGDLKSLLVLVLFLVLAVIVAILPKLAVILKPGLRNIPKRTATLTVSNIYTLRKHALIRILFLLIK